MIHFACPACNAGMKAAEGKARRKGTCPKCGAAFTLSACPACGRAIPLLPRELASKIVCAGCDTAFVLAAPPPATGAGGEPDPADSKAAVASEDLADLLPGEVRFPCTNCQASLKAPAEQIGAQTKCPQCGCPVRVPGPLVPMPPAMYRPPAQPIPEVVPVQEVIYDVLPADGEPPVPRFTREGALIECPHCRRRVHLWTGELNRRTSCPSCGGGLEAIAAGPGLIPADCPECGEDLEFSESEAGQKTRCPNCDATFVVPVEPILVLKTDKPHLPVPFPRPRWLVSSSGWP
jgi:DNA-directed RNA polymerase subunit M/transcription elongation factor TFIIS